MNQKQFDEAFNAAWKKACDNCEGKSLKESPVPPHPMVVALNVHRAIIVARHRELSERANVTKSEWTELEALRQAEVAYTILAASDLHGGFFDLFKSLLGKEVELFAEEKTSAAQAATDFFVARESLDD